MRFETRSQSQVHGSTFEYPLIIPSADPRSTDWLTLSSLKLQVNVALDLVQPHIVKVRLRLNTMQKKLGFVWMNKVQLVKMVCLRLCAVPAGIVAPLRPCLPSVHALGQRSVKGNTETLRIGHTATKVVSK